MEALQARLNRVEFNAWFNGAELAFIDGNDVGISFPTNFIRDHIKQEFGDLLRDQWRREMPELDRLHLIVKQAGGSANSGALHPAVNKWTTLFSPSRFSLKSLDDFVVGAPNRHALELIRGMATVSAAPASTTVLCAPSGMGKSHLLLGLAAALRDSPGGAIPPSIAYVPADHFIMHIIQARKDEQMREMRQAILAADVLLVDDLQQIRDKSWAALELLAIIEIAVSHGKRVAVGLSIPLNIMGDIGRAAAEKLQGADFIDLGGSNPEIRQKLIERRAAQGDFLIDEAAALLFSEKFHGDHRAMIEMLKDASAMRGSDLALSVQEIEDILQKQQPAAGRAVPIQRIQQLVALETGVRMADQKSASRKAPVVQARQIAMLLAREMSGLSLREIGEQFGGRDHTTVISSIAAIERLLATDGAVAARLARLRTKIVPLT